MNVVYLEDECEQPVDPMSRPCGACTAGPWEPCDPMCLCDGCESDS